jgi:hypothetical protein
MDDLLAKVQSICETLLAKKQAEKASTVVVTADLAKLADTPPAKSVEDLEVRVKKLEEIVGKLIG